MRTVLAALFVFAGLIGGVAIFSLFWPNVPAWAGAPAMVILLFGLVLTAFVIFNKPVERSAKGSRAATIKKLEEAGLLVPHTYKAKRAFQVEEFEDEGSHYFIELEDGAVLFLSGQYLYDYEPLEKKKVQILPRRFPNSDFVIRRHKDNGHVVDIICNGEVLEPEVVAPPFGTNDFGTNRIPEDGELFRDRTYDQLKNERLLFGANDA